MTSLRPMCACVPILFRISHRNYRHPSLVRLVLAQDLVGDMLRKDVRRQEGFDGDARAEERSPRAGAGSLEVHRDHAVHAHHLQQSTHVGGCFRLAAAAAAAVVVVVMLVLVLVLVVVVVLAVVVLLVLVVVMLALLVQRQT